MNDSDATGPDGGVAPDQGRKRVHEHLLERVKSGPLSRMGAGFITGVADDDPSGIATYSQAGAQFGLNMLWTMPVCLPMLAAIQSMCARIGRVTGKGLAANIRDAFPAPVLVVVVVLLLIANTLNIASDLAAMGEVGELVTGVNHHAMTIGFVLLTLALQLFVPYHRYVNLLKWLTFSVLAYAVVLFTIHVPWREVAVRTVLPRFKLDAQAASVIVGVFGTSISPYLFFWQASEEVEDFQNHAGARPLIDDAASAPAELSRISWDTWGGMFYAHLTAFFIILACGLTLNVAGITDIRTAAEAASALRPVAGPFASYVFALGIIGVGLLGVPVLAGSAAYCVAEAMGWKWGLERTTTEARGFYAVIAVSVLLGMLIQYSPVNPMKALFWSAVINGVVAVPLMVVILILAARRSVMGEFTAPRVILGIGWIATAFMGAAALWMMVGR